MNEERDADEGVERRVGGTRAQIPDEVRDLRIMHDAFGSTQHELACNRLSTVSNQACSTLKDLGRR